MIRFILLLLLIGCQVEPQIITVNNTIKEIQIINNTVECETAICNCECQETRVVTECDNKKFMQCQLQNGRLIAEMKYLNNITTTYLTNSSYAIMRDNLTECLEDSEELKEKLDEINKTLGG